MSEYTTPTTIEDAIDELARGMVDSTTEGSRSITYKKIGELQKALEQEKARTAAAKDHFGLRFTRLTPPPTG